MRRTMVVGVVVAGALGVAVAGCGSSSGGGGGAYGSAPATMASSGSGGAGAGAATVKTASGLGATLLVDGQGRTLYLFASDTGAKSTCSGACAQAWPPLTSSGAAHAGAGAQMSQLGTITRADGTKQVTYAGHPLYRFSGDAKAGDTTGQGSKAFGAAWYAVAPSGQQIVGGGSSGGGGSGGGNGAY